VSAILGNRQFWDAVFGWKIAPAEVVIADPSPAPRFGMHASLEKILGASLDQIWSDAEVSLSHHVNLGGVDEIRNAAGLVVNYRPKHFASALEAAVAQKILDLEARDADPAVVAELRKLAPLAQRHALRVRLRELDDLEPAKSSLQPREQPAFEPEVAAVPVEPSMPGFDANMRQLRSRRLQAEQDAKSFRQAKYDERNSLLARASTCR
jgi:hypothetical protein